MATEKELALLKRSALCLEDEDWDKVNELSELILNNNPENAEAYLNKFLASRKAKTLAEAAEQQLSFGGNKDYEKAIRFADEELLTNLKHFSKYNSLNFKYIRAKELMEHAMLPGDAEQASNEFEELGDFKDSRQMISRCNELILKLKNRNKSFKLYAIIGIIAIFLSGIAIVLKGQAEFNTTVQDFNETMAARKVKSVDKFTVDSSKPKYDFRVVDLKTLEQSAKENPYYGKTYTLRGKYTGYLPLIHVFNNRPLPVDEGIVIALAPSDEKVNIFSSYKETMKYNIQTPSPTNHTYYYTMNCFLIKDSTLINNVKSLILGTDLTVTGEYLGSEIIYSEHSPYLIHRFQTKKIVIPR